MTGSSVLNKLANKVVRQLSGLGKLPERAATELPEVSERRVDVCVIGGGPAGSTSFGMRYFLFFLVRLAFLTAGADNGMFTTGTPSVTTFVGL